eukprot:TRINITY_DN2489_c0_g1_i2.p2 TRINITY_DN2489_c0_g1~~TRINITY_DN2489_c0_g1_i2.p2  ORF type:complete len:124 (-),score=71.59 TRINITY_DN2489_c0_g1_i2:67-438(-)
MGERFGYKEEEEEEGEEMKELRKKGEEKRRREREARNKARGGIDLARRSTGEDRRRKDLMKELKDGFEKTGNKNKDVKSGNVNSNKDADNLLKRLADKRKREKGGVSMPPKKKVDLPRRGGDL